MSDAPAWTPRIAAPDPRRPLLLGRGAASALASTWVAVAIAGVVARNPRASLAPSLVAALALAVATLVGLRFSRADRAAIRGYVAMQSLLVGAAVVLTRGGAAIAWMPLLSQACLVLPRSRVALVAAGYLAVFLAALPPSSPRALLAQSVGMALASVFTVLFTELAMRERDARIEVERLAASLTDAQAELARLAVADERLRLSREIHDGVGHALTAARMQLEAARVVLDEDAERARSHLANASDLLREGLDDVRVSVRGLRDEREPAARFVERLAALCVGDAPTISFACEGELRALDPARAHTLFRVAQEALTNARRHAHATRVAVRLTYASDEIRLEVDDDGRDGHALAPGLGLTGLAERVERHGGSVRVARSDGGGTRLLARIPGLAAP